MLQIKWESRHHEMTMRGAVARERCEICDPRSWEHQVYGADFECYDQHMGLIPEIKTALNRFRPGSHRPACIDAGCGTGAAAAGCKKMFGKKIDIFAINSGKLSYPNREEPIEIIEGLLEQLPQLIPPERKVDFITAHNSLHYPAHAGTLPTVLQAFSKVLLPGGKVIVYQNQTEDPRAASLRESLYKEICLAVSQHHLPFNILKKCCDKDGVAALHLIYQPKPN